MTQLDIIRRIDIRRSERAYDAMLAAEARNWSNRTIAKRARACMDRARTCEAYRRLHALHAHVDTVYILERI